MIALVALITLLAQIMPTGAPTPQPPTGPPSSPPLRQNLAPVHTAPAPNAIPPVPGIDRTFAIAAVQGNNAEMDMAHLALQRSNVPEARQFAEKMISEHAGLANDMLPALTRVLGASAPPARLAPADALALAHLGTVPAPDVAQVYIVQQIGDHLAALTAFRTEAENGTDPQLRALARKWLPTIESHLQLAVDMTGHIGGNSPFKSH